MRNSVRCSKLGYQTEYTKNSTICHQSKADGGSLAFYEGGKEITGTSKTYTTGSTVSVKLIPDDGYAVSGFAIYGTSIYLNEILPYKSTCFVCISRVAIDIFKYDFG